jgi:hypothetical protein
MRRALVRLLATLIAAALLAACSGGGIPKHEGQEKQRDRYASYAGPPIDSFTWLGRYDGWESIGDNQLVLFTTPFDAYLLTVRPPCNDLNFANAIGLTSTGSTVSARLDSVTVKNMRCPIAEIRKVDYQRMQADRRAEAEKAKAGASTQQ